MEARYYSAYWRKNYDDQVQDFTKIYHLRSIHASFQIFHLQKRNRRNLEFITNTERSQRRALTHFTLLTFTIIQNYISQKMNFSPLKSSLFSFDFKSSNKKVVSCDINGWMETHAKPKQAIPKPIKISRTLKLNNSPAERTNFSKLKEMKSSLLKNTLRKFSERTPITAESESPSNSLSNGSSNLCSIRIVSVQKQEVRPIKIIEVSQFKQFDIHPTHTSTQPMGTGEKKPSLLRLRALSKKGARQTNINHLILGKEANIIENKVTENQYCGLKFFTRRLSSRMKN